MKKTKLAALKSRAEADWAVGILVNAQIAQSQKLAALEDQIAQLRDENREDLRKYEDLIDATFEQLAQWAVANPQEFPTDKKSIEFMHGTVGFRTCPWAVKQLNRGWTWAKIVEAINADPVFARLFLRQPPVEIDKEAILAARGTVAKEDLSAVGIKLEQGEEFFVDPKTEEEGPF